MDIRDVPVYVNGSSVPVGGELIFINEANRATVWCKTEQELDELQQYASSNYLKKGVAAVVAGVFNAQGDRQIGYAVFVESGFLTEVAAD